VSEQLKAPFPWFGGKSRVADIVWDRFGDVPNYVEPFFGSGAVLLGRPTAPGIETVNDRDCMVANLWRALQHDPDGVAQYADNPVNEADQHARHLWLVSQEDFREKIKVDPNFYDCKIAGWWVWGQCIWIGSGWCSVQLPYLGDAGTGVHRKRPHLGNAGKGVHRQNGGSQSLTEYMRELANRMRRVRVCCGDWSRVCGPSPTFKLGTTAVFLDPPYADESDRQEGLYSSDDLSVSHAVCKWAIANGDNPDLRIALCGYEGEHQIPDSWECLPWKAAGGYGSQSDGRGRENAARERIWFSPHCIKPGLFALFDDAAINPIELPEASA
jgi:DNA adenine methylase